METVTIKQYKTINEYLSETLDFLLKDTVKNNLILGQCLLSVKKDEFQENVLMLNVFSDGIIVITAFRNMKKVLLVGNGYSLQDLESLRNYFLDNHIPIQGVLGETHLSLNFSKLIAKNYVIHKTLLAHDLKALNDITLSEGVFELAQMEDLEVISNWRYLFQIECDLDNKLSREQISMDTKKRIELGRIFKWSVNNEIVSIAANSIQTDYYTKISLVYTPHEHRKKNYARSCVWSLTKWILDTGQKTICLFTDKDNPTSNKIYREIGYVPINEDYEIDFE